MEKYSDKFLNQTHKLKNAKIGMEFEFYMKDVSYYKTLEMLNDELTPVKVWGFKQYHSDFKPDSKNFKIEPDLSGGSSMVELVTGPLGYYDAKYFLINIIKFIQNYGYTNEKCSIHFNLSFDDDTDLNDINILKLILNTDEEEIYRAYPSRKGNVYAKSVKSIIPFKEYDFFNIPISVVKNNMRFPKDKYFGINFLNINNAREEQRVEFRYIGGIDYEKNLGQIIYFMDRFIISVRDSINIPFNNEDKIKLEEYLEDNISSYKNLSNYDNFIVELPKIQIQIDQRSNYDIVNSYYGNIYDKIYNFITSCEDIDECILNYVTTTQTLEVIDANVKTTSTIKTVDLVNCTLEGIFFDCYIVGSEIRNSQMTRSKMYQSDAYKCKVLNCNVESSTLEECYFVEGYLNSDMIGGVYRSGKLGPYASMDSNVKIINDHSNFFNTQFNPEHDKASSKTNTKLFGK